MYFYYALTSLKINCPWKKWVTTAQITQFVIDLFVVYFASYNYFAYTYFPTFLTRVLAPVRSTPLSPVSSASPATSSFSSLSTTRPTPRARRENSLPRLTVESRTARLLPPSRNKRCGREEEVRYLEQLGSCGQRSCFEGKFIPNTSATEAPLEPTLHSTRSHLHGHNPSNTKLHNNKKSSCTYTTITFLPHTLL